MGRRFILSTVLIAAALLWVGTIVAAYRSIRRFETSPGHGANAPSRWPDGTSIARTPGEWSLVMLVHPKCSCSRASVAELGAVLEKAPRDLRTYVLVFRPDEMPVGWERTEVVASAGRLRRANVLIDRNGRFADRFGGFTSGQTLLYDDRGRLRFAGGVTSLRGHAGMNRGRKDVIDIVTSRAGTGTHPVFGCAIAPPRERTP